MGDESKLPKWTRDELAHLRRQLAEARAERDRFLALAPPSDTGVVRHEGIAGEGPSEVWLEAGAVVRFHLGADPHDVVEATVEARGGKPRLRILGWATIAVYPSAANALYIGLAGR